MRSAMLTLAVVAALAASSFAGDEPVSGRIGSLAFDSKGEQLVTVGWDTPGSSAGEMDAWTKGTSRGDIHIWNVASGAEIAHFGNDCGGLFDVAFSPDDKTITTAGRAANAPKKGEVRIWDARTHKLIRSLAGPTNWVICLACSSDGKLIAAGGFDRTIRIWEAATGKEVKAVKAPKWMPRAVGFSKDGKTLVAGYGNGLVSLFRVGTWDEINFFEGGNNFFLLSAEISPDGKHVIAAGAEQQPAPGRNQEGLIYVWDVATGAQERADHVDQLVSDVAFSPNGKYYAACGFVSRIWTSDKGEQVADLKREGSTSGDKICFSPDGRKLALGALNNVTVWDVSGLASANRGK
jgi:WD40 repeat protein